MPFSWAYSKEFHRRFKNPDDKRVEAAYDGLLEILTHTKSDTVAAKMLGVSRRTVARWRDTGFTSGILDRHYKEIRRVDRDIQRRLKAATRKAGPGAIIETRPIAFKRPGPTIGSPGAIHVYTKGASLEQIWKYMTWAQAQVAVDGLPKFEAFYFTIHFGSKYQGQFWDGNNVKNKPSSKNDSGVYIQGGKTYNTKLARECASLHFPDSPPYGNNLTLYECLTDVFFRPDSKIIRVVFLERKIRNED